MQENIISNIKNKLDNSETLLAKELRNIALEKAKVIDYPNKKQENWKYSDISSINISEYKPNFSQKLIDQNYWSELEKYLISPESNISINFYNGKYLESLSKVNENIKLEKIENSLKKQETSVYTKDNKNIKFFDCINISSLDSGIKINVPQNCKIEDEIYINNVIKSEKQLINTKNKITIEKFSSATIIEHICNIGENSNFNCNYSEIVLEEGATVNYYLVQTSSNESININNTKFIQHENSTLNNFVLTNGNKLNHSDINIELVGDNVLSNSFVSNNASENENHNINLTNTHIGKHCNSDTVFRTVIKDKATSTFSGLIKVEPNATQTNADLQCKSLELSNFASANVRPLLEINCDDVKCSHGATIGHLDEDAIFYLRSRGLSVEEAKKMLIQAFITPITENIKVNSLSKFYDELIKART